MKKDTPTEETFAIQPAVYQACESIGKMMELWGFKRIHGMLWTYIYLQAQPVTANDIREALGISSGLASMTLQDLQHWDVVHRHSMPGDRRDRYTAEANIWKPILKVLREREYYQMTQTVETLKRLQAQLASQENEASVFAAGQLGGLIQLGDMALTLFGQFLDLGALVMRDMPRLALAAGVGQTLLAFRRFLTRELPEAEEKG